MEWHIFCWKQDDGIGIKQEEEIKEILEDKVRMKAINIDIKIKGFLN